MRIFALFLFIFVLNSCGHLVTKRLIHNQESLLGEQPIPNISHFELPTSVSYKKMSESYQSAYGDVPLDDNAQVDKWVKYFTGRGRPVMETYLERSSRYLPIMKSVMREAQLPEDLVYVALIESGFSPRAHSRSNAVGYWQFISGTGKRYGLKINGFVDERRDPVLSTRAAVEYFKDLYKLFGSWHLALSAYNAGEYRVNRAVLKHYNRNFWYLTSKKALPRETMNYVPKFIAAVRIAKHPQKYGFYNIKYQTPLNYDVVSVYSGVSLKRLSTQLDIPFKDLKLLNPMYKGEYVPVYAQKTILRMPVGVSKISKSILKRSYMAKPDSGYYHHYYYKVRRGDTLYQIARKNRTTVSKLRRYNNLGRKSLIRVGQKLKVPSKNLVRSKRNIASAKKSPTFYVVQRGDSLTRIAKKHKLTVAQLRSFNNLKKSSTIHPRQKLRIKKKPAPAQRRLASNKNHHVVRRGDTLIGIARKYKVSLPALMRANSMTFKSVLLTGKRLIIPK